MEQGKCAIWGTDVKLRYVDYDREGDIFEYDSPQVGGLYRITNSCKILSNSWSLEFKYKLTQWIINKKISGENVPFLNSEIINKEVELISKISPIEKLNRVFLFCLKNEYNVGDLIFPKYRRFEMGLGCSEDDEVKELMLAAYCDIRSAVEINPFVRMLHALGYIDDYELTYKAFEKIEALKTVQKTSNQAFVAMWFDSSLNSVFENAIEPAIREAGYEPRIIRNKEHNNKIDDEIIAEIRRSKFVIADFTCGFAKDGTEAIARGGVYYEAGFAQGLGLPVIWTCRKDIISHVHFDTRQYNHIDWEDEADLKARLLNRIRATIL